MKNYSSVGAISRSSKFLYKKMSHDIDFLRDIHIVEYGPGDGIFTDELLKEITPQSKISIFEIDEGFYNFLKEKYKNNPQINVYKEDVCNIKKYFPENSIDYIVSSLPLAFIKKNTVGEILTESKNILKSNGFFIQYQYFLQNKDQIKTFFPKIKYRFTLLNFPPAFVYICNKDHEKKS
ncbi:MAG: class I SAM-dependent methyltransferase [Candidatus Altimarinota bacterium]